MLCHAKKIENFLYKNSIFYFLELFFVDLDIRLWYSINNKQYDIENNLNKQIHNQIE